MLNFALLAIILAYNTMCNDWRRLNNIVPLHRVYDREKKNLLCKVFSIWAEQRPSKQYESFLQVQINVL